VAELTDKAPVYEIGCQTEFKINRPPTPHKMPKLTGVSKKTLTEDNELFLFDDEVEPILSVLCGKTLEIARMEVLQEEELAEMNKQQQNFASMRKNEEAEIKKMEETEAKKLEAYQAKKSLERNRREAKKIAHKKVVSRILAKQFTSKMKFNSFEFLRDIGMFRDSFKQTVLESDVMPWLLAQTSKFVSQMDSHSNYPTTLIGNYMFEAQETHQREVLAYANRIKERRAAEEKARQDKISQRLRRKREKDAKRRAEEVARLRDQIKAKFVDKVTHVEDILKQEFTEVDGWSREDKGSVTALGGFLGQLMLVLNTIAKFYPQLDRPVRTGRSVRPAKSRQSQNDDAKSARSGKSDGDASELPRQILKPEVVQNFIYTYILEKLKSDKFSLCVDARYEKFLNNLANPLKLNEMRTMKQDKYEQLRTLLSNFVGSPVLRIIKDNMKELDMDPDVFDLVYEGFWDLYTFHSQLKDVSARKLSTWIQKIKLVSGPDNFSKGANGEEPGDEDDEDDEGREERKSLRFTNDEDLIRGEDKIQPMTAIVRLKIPKVQLTPEYDDEGNEVKVEVDESTLEDIPFEDKCLQMVTKSGD